MVVPYPSNEIQLKVEALRYLVDVTLLSANIWKPDIRELIRNILKKSCGSSDADHISSLVSMQALLTSLRRLHKIFTDYCEKLLRSSRKAVVNRHAFIFEFESAFRVISFVLSLDDITETDYPDAYKCLLSASTHASLHTMLSLPKTAISAEYRRHIDFIRSIFTDKNTAKRTSAAIETVKRVVTCVVKKDRATALAHMSEYEERNPVENLCTLLSNIIAKLEQKLGPLFLIEAHYHYSTGSWDKANKRKRVPRSSLKRNAEGETVPNFFSDAETDDTESDGVAPRATHTTLPAPDTPVTPEAHTHRASRWSSKRSSRNTNRGSRHRGDTRKSRLSKPPFRQSHSTHSASGRESSLDGVDSSLCFDESLVLDACDDLDSNMFPSSLPQGEPSEVDSRELRQPPAKRRRTVERSPCIQSEESSSNSDHQKVEATSAIQDVRNSPTHSESKDSHDGNIVDDAEDRKKSQEKQNSSEEPSLVRNEAEGESGGENEDVDEDEDQIQKEHRGQDFKNGKTSLRQLRTAAKSLDRARKSDPLIPALQDASNAIHHRLRSGRYLDGPGENARDASPIPESPEATNDNLTRKRRSNRRSLQKSDNDVDEQVRLALARETRSKSRGRFQKFEDAWLLDGLRKYGWGSWTIISKNFGEGEAPNSRTGMSLKDRARTLDLDPQKYVKAGGRLERRGRGRGQITPTKEGLKDGETDDDKDESDAIKDDFHDENT